MNTNDYIRQNQILIDRWKNKFDVLFDWNLGFVYDGEHYCYTTLNFNDKTGIIYMCDIDTDENYIIHEVIKSAFIVSVSNEQKLSLIEDLVAAVTKNLDV